MQLKTILDRCHPIPGFVYGAATFQPGPTYDTARSRRTFQFIPFWGFAVVLLYAMRRIDCARCGVTVERVPWSNGKERTCTVYRAFLANWARRLSWAETARVFRTSWGVVFRAVEWVVTWGLEHRDLEGIRAIGVDEIAVAIEPRRACSSSSTSSASAPGCSRS